MTRGQAHEKRMDINYLFLLYLAEWGSVPFLKINYVDTEMGNLSQKGLLY